MADLFQCDNCGAVLAKDDVFCGECGAPRASPPSPIGIAADQPPEVPEPVLAEEPAPHIPPTSSPGPAPLAEPSDASEAGWRVATIVPVGLGLLACLAGLLTFLIVGSIGGTTTTPQENWLLSALCCLLPLGGIGVILAAVGAAIWYTRLRSC
jgi:hypothetical protein